MKSYREYLHFKFNTRISDEKWRSYDLVTHPLRLSITSNLTTRVLTWIDVLLLIIYMSEKLILSLFFSFLYPKNNQTNFEVLQRCFDIFRVNECLIFSYIPPRMTAIKFREINSSTFLNPKVRPNHPECCLSCWRKKSEVLKSR